MANVDINSINSKRMYPANYSDFMSEVEGQLWVLASQLKAAKALLCEDDAYDTSESLVGVGIMLTDMNRTTERLLGTLDESGGIYETSEIKAGAANG